MMAYYRFYLGSNEKEHPVHFAFTLQATDDADALVIANNVVEQVNQFGIDIGDITIAPGLVIEDATVYFSDKPDYRITSEQIEDSWLEEDDSRTANNG